MVNPTKKWITTWTMNMEGMDMEGLILTSMHIKKGGI